MHILPATIDDADSIAALMHQLGYPTTKALVQIKLAAFAGRAMDRVLVAREDGSVVGVISLHVQDLFHQEGCLGRITSFVINERARGRGVGGMLVRAADDFFVASGCRRAEVTSGDHRPMAHAFYQQQGYQEDERRFVKHFQSS